MAVTTLLTIGPSHDLVQNVVYAMPARKVRVHALAAVEISVDGSTWDALTGSETVGAEASSGFLRCPGGATSVILKAT